MSYHPAAAASTRMKPLHRRADHHHHLYHRLLKKYYKWVIWISLSLYFLLSSSFSPSYYLIKSTSLAKTTLSSNTNQRALIETTAALSSPVKIYIYDLPPSYNRAWLVGNDRCGRHLFAAEVAIHLALLDSPARTLDPDEADFFFIPVYVSCNFSTPNGFPSLSHARPLISSAVSLVSSSFPFWNRSRGRDHLFVASHDFGACFHAMEEVAVEDGIPEFMRESIVLQTFGMRTPHRCQEAEHVVIPPHVPAEILAVAPHPEASKRDIFVHFRGKMEVHPKNVSGRFYSKKVRTVIWERYGDKKGYYIKRKRGGDYWEEMARSVFCLCPRGWAPWSPRLVEAVALGCVPVVVADGIRLPFEAAVPWADISLTVSESDVGEQLEKILGHVAATNLTAIQRRLWDPRIRRALVFNRRMEAGDATWHVLTELHGKLDRSPARPAAGGHVTAVRFPGFLFANVASRYGLV